LKNVQKPLLSLLVLVVAVAVAGCGSSKKATSTTTPGRPHDRFVLQGRLITDIGGLNDRGFNHLAYVGPCRRRSPTWASRLRVVHVGVARRIHPESERTRVKQGYNLRDRRRLYRRSTAMKAVAKSFPKTHSRSSTFRTQTRANAPNV